MGNCLVTKLKGVVNNDGLVHFGSIQYTTTAANEELTIKCDESIRVIAKDGKTFTINSVQYTNYTQEAFSNVVYNIPVQGTVIEITNTLNINTIISNSLKSSDIQYMLSLTGVTFKQGGSLNELSLLSNLKTLNAETSSISGEISILGTLTSLKDIYLGRTSVSGNISDVVQPTLKILSIANSAVTGTVESFITALQNNNITNTIYFTVYNTNVTANGYTISSEQMRYLNYESNSKYTLRSSETLAASTTLGVYGYSMSEIETWQAAGKRVWDISTNTWYEPTN